MIATTFTITGEMLFWTYATLHVLYGLVTHYHSVAEVRRWNKQQQHRIIPARRSVLFFIPRMLMGFPMFFISRILSPTGNKWHMSADEIRDW